MEEINSNPEILSSTQDPGGNEIVAQTRRAYPRGVTKRQFLQLSAATLASWVLNSCVPIPKIEEPPKTVLTTTPIPEPTPTITAPKIEEYPRDPETILREAGLEGLTSLYIEQSEYAEKYGSTPYPDIFNDIKALAGGSASPSITAIYTGNWGESTAPQARIDAALEKVEKVELQGFSNEFQMRHILATIAKTYPTLLLATPNILIKRDIDSYAIGAGPQALADRVLIPEPLINSPDKKGLIKELGIIIHEFSHYFGGDYLDRNVVKRIKPFVGQDVFAEFISKASESSLVHLRTYTKPPLESELDIAYSKLENTGYSSLTNREKTLISLWLQDGHQNSTFGGESDLSLEGSVNPESPYYSMDHAKRIALSSLFKMITPEGKFTEGDFNPGLRLFNG